MAHDDLLAKAGIRVGNPAERRLINDEPSHRFVVKGFKNRGSVSRAGSQSSPRENLLRSLGIPDEGALEKATLYGNDGDLEYVPDTYTGQDVYHQDPYNEVQVTRQEVLDTHGEHFHSDIDPDVERILSEVTEAGTHFDYTRQFGRSMGAFDGDDDGDDNTEGKEEEEKSKLKAKDVKKARRSGPGSRGGRVIGHTRSGKPIYDNSAKNHSGFTKEDHADARDLHTSIHEKMLERVMHGGEFPSDSAILSTKAKDYHARLAKSESDDEEESDEEPDDDEDDQEKSLSGILDDLIKGEGEGSRGGKVIGHTSSGKPIYIHEPNLGTSSAGGIHGKNYKGWNWKDHEEAYAAHSAAANSLVQKHGGYPKGDDAKTYVQHAHNKDAHYFWAKKTGHPELNKSLGKSSAGEGSKGGQVIGHTRSGKPIYAHDSAIYAHGTGAFSGYSKGDHFDAYTRHSNDLKYKRGRSGKKNFLSAMKLHSQAYYAAKSERDPDLPDFLKSKSGEGSRGGKVIGHTRSGKPVYEGKAASKYSDFSRQDHKDAAAQHMRHWHDDDSESADGSDQISVDHDRLSLTPEQLKNRDAKRRGVLGKKSVSVLDDLVKAVTGEGSRGGVVVGHTSSGKPIYQGETHSTRIHTTTGEETSHVNSYIQHAGDEKPYGGENYHVFYQRKGAQTQGDNETDADRDYVGYVIRHKDEGIWSGHPEITSMSAYKQAKNFKTRGEAEHHILSTYKRYQEASKPKDQKAASVQEANDLYKALMDISLNKATDAQEDKVHQVMREFKEGTLRSGSKTGPKVKNRKQAIAIAMNQSGQSNKSDDEASDLLKSRIFPIGTVHTFSDGKQYKKVANNEWHPVKGEGPRRYDYAAAVDHNSKIEVGQHVRVNWTAGSFGHYTGKGTVTKVNAKSVAVALDEPVADQSGLGGSGYPAGRRIVVPRADMFSGANSKWAWHNGVFPVHGEGKKSSIDELLDLVKAGSSKEVAPTSTPTRRTVPSARNSFIKAAGPGGVLFDFGHLTGNLAADRYSELANQHAEPQQAAILKSQKAEYDQALVEYVTTGRTREQDVSPQQGADVQKSDEQHGAQTADVSKPVFMGDFRTQFESKQARVGSEVVKAQSETDQAVIEMFGKNLGDAPTDMTMAGKTPVVLDLASGAAIDMQSGEQIQPAE